MKCWSIYHWKSVANLETQRLHTDNLEHEVTDEKSLFFALYVTLNIVKYNCENCDSNIIALFPMFTLNISPAVLKLLFPSLLKYGYNAKDTRVKLFAVQLS